MAYEDRPNPVPRSWSLPDLVFAELTTPCRTRLANKYPALIKSLYKTSSHVAVLITRETGTCRYFVGMTAFSDMGRSIPSNQIPSKLKKHYACPSVPEFEMKKVLAPFSSHIGTARVIHTEAANNHNDHMWTIPEGAHLGIMFLGIPIPKVLVSDESFAVLDMVEKASSPSHRHTAEMRDYIQKQSNYLQRLDDGSKNGYWYTQVFYLATTETSLNKLRSYWESVSLEGIDGSSINLQSQSLDNLWPHVCAFSASTILQDHPTNGLDRYQHLSPLTSKEMLSIICAFTSVFGTGGR